MLKTLVSIYSLILAVAILLLGSGLLGTTIALRSGLEGYSTPLIGLVMSGFFIGFMVGSYVCPAIVRRVGHIRAFATLAALAAAAILIHGLVVHPAVWFVLRVVTGVSMMGMYLVIESWLNEQTPPSLRGRVFAAYMTSNLLALGVSQYLILIYGAQGVAPFAFIAFFFAIALIPVALTRVREPALHQTAELRLRRLFAISPLGAMSAFVAGLLNGGYYGLGPVFGTGVGMGPYGVALFMSAVVGGGAILQWPIGHLSDHHDRRGVLAVVCLLAAVAAGLVYFTAGHSRPLLFASAMLYGGFAFSVYSLGVAHTNDHVGPLETLGTMRALLLLNGIGASVGPIVAGLLIQWQGYRMLMAYFGVLLLGLGIFTLVRMYMAPPVPIEEQVGFVPLARTSQAALELDPRTQMEPELDLRGCEKIADLLRTPLSPCGGVALREKDSHLAR